MNPWSIRPSGRPLISGLSVGVLLAFLGAVAQSGSAWAEPRTQAEQLARGNRYMSPECLTMRANIERARIALMDAQFSLQRSEASIERFYLITLKTSADIARLQSEIADLQRRQPPAVGSIRDRQERVQELERTLSFPRRQMGFSIDQFEKASRDIADAERNVQALTDEARIQGCWLPGRSLIDMLSLTPALAAPLPPSTASQSSGAAPDPGSTTPSELAGTWAGVFERDDTHETGALSTEFTVRNGRLGGWHYQDSWVIEDVSVSGDRMTFSHKYGDNCRATHRFNVINYDTREAESRYTVTCPNGSGHTGTINYRRAASVSTNLSKLSGTWTGVFERNDNQQTGGLSTVFTVENGRLGGWHYQNSWVIENAAVSGDAITFSHKYGDNCRATHRFTVSNYDTREAESRYTVTCTDGPGHTGTIKYRK